VHKLAQAALTFIRKHDLLRAGDRVGIAVSGGADSVALLRLMLELRQEIGLVVSVVHLNHKLRGADSEADEYFVRRVAEDHRVELISETRDVKAFAAQEKVGIEAAARELRYELFERLLGIGVYDKIATAHTLDDQAETLLLKLARGAGTRGLAGIYPKISIQQSAISTQEKPAISGQLSATSKPATARGQTIVRPLLATRREDLRNYLTEIGQAWREDSSNRDLRHTRNRIRHGILPRFERHVNPSVRDALAETAEIARGEEEYWAEEIARLLPQVWRRDPQGGVLKRQQLDEFPLALRRRMVRAAGESLGMKLPFRHIEGILAPDSGGNSIFLAAGWSARLCAKEIRFRKRGRFDTDYRYEFSVPGRVPIIEVGLTIEALRAQAPKEQGKYESEGLLDPDLVGLNLIVRSWRAGECFWPAHSKEPKKIKELLQDRHITGDEKRGWPVIASGGEVVWVSGFGVRRDFRAKNGEGILIRESRTDTHQE
jgi:tRNA(Ile)-lysidine synthase